ncbi:MAG: C39 family peptidase [Vulcanimicrobiota bacterium]
MNSNWLATLLLLGGLCGCGADGSAGFLSTGGAEQASSGGSATTPPAGVPAVSLLAAPGEVVAPPTPKLGATPLLNEVVFVPADRLDPFVEIKPGTSNPDPLTLRNQDGQELQVPTVTGLTVVNLANNPSFLNPKSGSVTLLAGSTVLDFVAWGDTTGATLGGLGFVRTAGPGDALIRTPQSSEMGAGYWFMSASASPGQPNPGPLVPALFPSAGLIGLSGERLFSWYPLPGADSYRVQIASDRDFSSLLLDQVLTSVGLKFSLPAGEYYWRVQAIYPGNQPSNFTAPTHIRLLDSLDALNASPRVLAKSLTVPLLRQRKDTHLLLLEALCGEDARPNIHPWNSEHEAVRTQEEIVDPACDYNCVIASLIMMNHFLGGNLSQDRLSYELFHQRAAGSLPNYADGPERDFQFGDGIQDARMGEAMQFALGGAGVLTSRLLTRDQFWDVLKQEIDQGRPMIINTFGGAGSVSGHARVVKGYKQLPNVGRVLILNNPWDPTEEAVALDDIPPIGYDIPNTRLEIPNSISAVLQLSPLAPVARAEDASINTDTDGDGLCDFDEARFGTDPTQKDSDMDCINDLQEIASTMYRPSVFGPPIPGVKYYNQQAYTLFVVSHGLGEAQNFVFGFASAFGLDLSKTSRDPDGDKLRPERDLNSDNGQLPDFLEDDNGNGKYDPGETSPLAEDDDRLQITGTITEDIDETGTAVNPGGFTLFSSLHTVQKIKYTYDLKVEGKTVGGSVKIEESNYTSDFEVMSSIEPKRYTINNVYSPRTWTSSVALRDWFCDFFETGVAHNSLTFQVSNIFSNTGGPDGHIQSIETDYFSDGHTTVFDRSREGHSAVFPLVQLNFKDGKMNFTGTNAGKTFTVDLTARH